MKLFFWLCFPFFFLVGNENKNPPSENQEPKTDTLASVDHQLSQPNRIPPDFNREVRSILENTCISCHGVDSQKGGLRLDT
ncbi:MAG TPA: hypothetical protein DHU78_06135, partial [Opitutae bacterium]|nr:hypothetical protein [Opitutae bacterium]